MLPKAKAINEVVMTMKRPEGLSCIYCGEPIKPNSTTTQRKYADYHWRFARCDCRGYTWWGSPLSADQPYLVMRYTPKPDGGYPYPKTININYALPIPATVSQLLSKARAQRIAEYLQVTGKTKETIDESDRRALLQIMGSVK